MKPEISEFSYGYALTENIIQGLQCPIIDAPIFPSTVKEGQENSGYDVKINKIGFPLFVQFKLSHKMVKNNASEIRFFSCLSTPFWRMCLMPKKYSNQHKMLLELDNGLNEVYYAAPYFRKQNELSRYYFDKTVIENSYFIKPNSIGSLPDNNEHHISTKSNSNIGYLFSNVPRKVENIISPKAFKETIMKKLKEEDIVLKRKIKNIKNDMLNIIKKHTGLERQDIIKKEFKSNLDELVVLAHYYFSVELFLITKNDNLQRVDS